MGRLSLKIQRYEFETREANGAVASRLALVVTRQVGRKRSMKRIVTNVDIVEGKDVISQTIFEDPDSLLGTDVA